MQVLGVIPARGGSKRVPRKNLRLLRGVPLIAYTIRAAQAACKLTDWVVSTEDKEIADLALSYGAHVVKRPDYLAQDDTSSGAVVRHALDWMEETRKYDMVVLLHPSSPIRDPKHIDQAIDFLSESECDTLCSVCKIPEKTHLNVGHIWNERWRASKGEWHVLNASIYAMKRDWFVQNKNHTDVISVPFVMDRFHSIDVDEEIDLEIAELYLARLSQRPNYFHTYSPYRRDLDQEMAA